MCRLKIPLRLLTLGPSLFLLAIMSTSCSTEDGAQSSGMSATTVFEGARLIVGDGQAIEDAAFVVEDGRFTQVGRRDEVEVPEGASRVDLSGKTVTPAFINAHMHLAVTREERIEQLQHNAYYGAAAVASMGQDSGDVPFQIRVEIIPGASRSLTAGRGITRPEPGRSEAPYWVDTEAEARAAVRELADQGVDIVKIWVDDRGGQYEKLTCTT